MEITITNFDFVAHSVKARDVFSESTMRQVYFAIVQDYKDDITEGWTGITPKELGYNWNTPEGELILEKKAVECALEASEMSLFDFIQRFADYVDEQWDEYDEFEYNVRVGNYRLKADIPE